jgi:competence protein ComEA
MKYVLVAAAIAAAAAALWFRPPHDGSPVPSRQLADGAASPSLSRLDRSRAGAAPRIIVYVAGEVVRPGVYALPAGARAQSALARAGGPKPDADLVAVNLAAPLEDGEEIAIAPIGAAAAQSGRRQRSPRRRAPRSTHRRGRHARSSAAAPAPGSIDLNSASASDLERVPGIGAVLAERIVAYRASNGPFASVDELGDVAGISEAQQDRIARYVLVASTR